MKFVDLFSSLIITGCKEWTLFEYTYYRGDCTCVFPVNNGPECRPGIKIVFTLKGSSYIGSCQGVAQLGGTGLFCVGLTKVRACKSFKHG